MVTTTRAETKATPQPSSTKDLSLSPAESSYKPVTERVPGATPTSVTAPSTSSHAHSTPVAAIVGAVLGFVILCALVLAIFHYIRKRRLTKVYKAPAYPSPFVRGDMTPQLSSKFEQVASKI